jgi:hypothetical protein
MDSIIGSKYLKTRALLVEVLRWGIETTEIKMGRGFCYLCRTPIEQKVIIIRLGTQRYGMHTGCYFQSKYLPNEFNPIQDFN